MKLEPTKQSKTIKVVVAVLLAIQVFICSLPFVEFYNVGAKEKISFSVLQMMIGFDTSSAPELYKLAILSSLFIIVPAICFFIVVFDKYRPIKFIACIICSLLGVFGVSYLIGPQMLAFGSVVALLLYILIAFLSVLGLFSRYLKTEEPNKEKSK